MGWKRNDLQFLYEVLKYSHLIQLKDLTSEVEEKIERYMNRKGWEWSWGNGDELIVSEIVEGINIITNSLNLSKLNKKLTKMLLKQIKRKEKEDGCFRICDFHLAIYAVNKVLTFLKEWITFLKYF